MHYIFDVKDAEQYGLEEAVMLYNIKYWITLNKANNTNFNDGRTWTYNSVSAFKKLFPFWTERQIGRILKSLIDKHILITGNYNKIAYDRTLWYAFSDESILLNGEMEITEMSNRNIQNVTPIPDSNTDNKPIVNTNKRKRFIPPTREEIQSFTNEHQCHIDIDAFVDHYESNGWKIGNNKMSDWKATVRNWHRRDKKSVKGHSGKQSLDKTLNECEQLFESIKREK
jgi:hypothetical protein